MDHNSSEPPESVERCSEKKDAAFPSRSSVLLNTEDKYFRMLENLKEEVLFFTHDVDKNFFEVSPSVENILGYTPDEFIKTVDESWTAHPVNARAREHTELSAKGLRQPPYEIDVYHKDGSSRRLIVTEVPIFDENRNVAFVEGMARDITQKKKDEEKLEKYRVHLEELVENRTIELKNSQQRLLEIIDFLPDPTYVVDNDRKIIAWNKAIESLLELKKSRVIGKPYHEFLRPFYGEDTPLLIDLIGVESKNPIFRNFKIQKNGNLLFTERQIPSKNFGAVKYTWITATPILNRDGLPVGAIESIRDVTHIKKVEKKIIENERQLSTLMNNLPGMAYRWVKKDKWILDFVSNGCKLVTGYSPSFFTGRQLKQFKDMIHPEDRDRIPKEIFNSIIEKNANAQVEYRIINSDGIVKWVFDKAEGVLFDKDEIVSIEGFIADFTLFKQMEQKLRHENLYLRSTIKDRYKFDQLIGNSREMQRVYELILKASGTGDSVYVFGESGTGKELVARAIHNASERRDKKFVTVNCGAIPENLIESEFFGSKKGAFTGAEKDKAGFLDLANGGTLFLDEIGEISMSMQVKLLRAIEGGGYSPVGSNDVIKPDLRIITASNRNLADLVERNVIREDFFFRIHVFPIHLPPLRERDDDIFLLADHFLKSFGNNEHLVNLSPQDLLVLKNYHWPGNVRELQNALRRYISLRNLDFLKTSPDFYKPGNRRKTDRLLENVTSLGEALLDFERKYIQRVLEQNQWQKAKSAKLLGISRKTLFRKMKSCGLN